MVRPVVRPFLVALALLLTSSPAFSHRSSTYYDSKDGIGIYPFDKSEEEDDFSFDDVSDHFPNKWSLSAEFDSNTHFTSPPSMMDTFEKFKRQAVKSVVPGDETVRLKEGGSSSPRLNTSLSWQTATLISVLCVGAVVVGVILGVLYWPKAAFGERRDSLEGSKRAEAVGSQSHVSDRSLAHSAQMYHYQQQKQQMLAMEQAAGRNRSSDSNSDSEGEEPDVNVYECPGLATASELEVKNPLFEDEHGEGIRASSARSSK
ncbi:Neural proliferation differentiation and control protein [Echinococcus granulosus]|uniref:Neural proliferation differentiation n=1 Tax=Echinococcus granulosus TaxID=6210 RepID=U6JA31_ECHGR|nr:Neural proliferation differentiation and control protein [Echinococcus granulosus]EUB60406.1 Neural proliferation differentiation and control protein [Echinococcus granulosus]CDS19294.1 neural proliferation differentiation [Echinococcus granulosus]